MAAALFLLLLLFSLSLHFQSSSSTSSILSKGSFFSVEKPADRLTSPDGVFTAGFHQVGNNSFIFAVWFTNDVINSNTTIVWMANRDQPVNGKHSTLFLLNSGNLILTDAVQSILWSTSTTSLSPATFLTLLNSGNLVLCNSDIDILWQSFDHPTDTLLPTQLPTRNTILVSMRSPTNHSGFYKLFFDDDNLLRLLFDGPDVSSVYWFEPWLTGKDAGRSTDNSTRLASMDALGKFVSSDKYILTASDYGAGTTQRRLTVDSDGNVRLRSQGKSGEKWVVTGQIIQDPCKIHGVCGPNSLCSYEPNLGRRC